MNNLKAARVACGLTQTEVARMVGISQNGYSYWETGKTKIDNESLKKLAEIFHTTVDYLLGHDGSRYGFLTGDDRLPQLLQNDYDNEIPPGAGVYAETQFEIIKHEVQSFQASLAPNEDVALLLASFGRTVLLEVSEIGFIGSALLVFKGMISEEGNKPPKPATLIQHVSQLNFMLTTVYKPPEEASRPVGFTASWS